MKYFKCIKCDVDDPCYFKQHKKVLIPGSMAWSLYKTGDWDKDLLCETAVSNDIISLTKEELVLELL